MAPVNADVAAVEAQLCSIRRRRNGLAAQRAIASTGSAVLVAAAVVIATALRGSTASFAFAATLAAVATIACVGYVAWLTWREWLSLPATAHLADTRAALDDRLTTLLAVAPVSPPPPLRPLLLDQVIQASPQWGIDALAPRRVSPWLALVPAALAVLVATTFYARPPATTATTRPLARTAALPGTAPADGTVAPRSTGGVFTTAPDRDAAAAHSGEKAITQGSARGASTTDGTATGATGRAPLSGDADGEVAAAGTLDKLRQSIQDTFGGTPDAGERGQGSGAARTGRGDQRAGDGPRPDGTPSTARSAEARQDPAQGAPRAQQADPAAPPAAAAQGSHGNGRGGAANGTSGGVLGAAAPRTDGSTAAPVGIKLSAITGVSPSQTEPQRRRDVPAAAANATRPTGPLPDLADEQLADATVRPLDVGPEHEAIIRRIFTRE